MPTKVEIVQQCLAMWDAGDLDGAHQYVTDDFRFESDPAPEAYGYKDVVGKEQHKDFFDKVREKHAQHNTQIGNICEESGKVKVQATTGFDYQNRREEVLFNAVYTFSGNKISHLYTKIDPECASRLASLQ